MSKRFKTTRQANFKPFRLEQVVHFNRLKGKFLVGFNAGSETAIAEKGKFNDITPTVAWKITDVSESSILVKPLCGTYKNAPGIITHIYKVRFKDHDIIKNWFIAPLKLVKKLVKRAELYLYINSELGQPEKEK